jgi:hypothetical protein
MIRWYDFVAAFIVADLSAAFFFSIPIIGGILAYALVVPVWDYYCKYRLEQE